MSDFNPQRYDAMQYRRCPQSGVLLPAIALGLWHNFGDVNHFNQAYNILATAFNLGITHFDLANNYGPPPGHAESLFGEIFSTHFADHRDDLFISTKAGHLMWEGPYGDWGSRKHLLSSLDRSLRRMQLDYVDLFYSHRHDPETPMEETMGALATAVQQGKALYVGISKYSPEDTERAVKILADMGVRCLVHQVRYNIIESEPEQNLFPMLQKLNLGAVAFCPLAQGLLTSKYIDSIPADSRAASDSIFLTPDKVKRYHQRILKLNQLAQERGQTLAQMALAWVLREGTPITSAIIGASRPQQIIENVKALQNLSFTEEESKIICE